MKGKKKHRATGGFNAAEEDLREDPEMRVNAGKIKAEATEKKSGGRAGRASGGHVHHEDMSNMKHAKHIGPVRGSGGSSHAGKKPRASGGRTGADSAPFSSARKGSPAPGRNVEMMD